ncbi:hypothetical protein FA10DRAFT_267573 [Acaromyces ingoldii]|uniref:Uncharacterized protein n=1 Tax=Acaromyces ingoldii TaxID=215250 RepID=A0A316YIG0_9BASI|nr:hypothetical protein FA10DRAFT_267573 [Acaromyces ingoldii]PWN88961.1 hypothetical protein FA10DRAFT_267573 [Acaromyces ingoldii]
MSEAKCPLGFTGTPPAGHPSIPGFKIGGDSAGQATLTSKLAAYKPSTLLIVDALFLGLCLVAAVWRDDLKAAYVRWSGTPTPK